MHRECIRSTSTIEGGEAGCIAQPSGIHHKIDAGGVAEHTNGIDPAATEDCGEPCIVCQYDEVVARLECKCLVGASQRCDGTGFSSD